MAVQLSVAVRNARVNAVESTVGTSPKLQLRSGAQPATCATADSGTLLVELTLPSDWQGAGSSGAAAKSGTWSGNVTTAGTAAHFRLKDSAGTTCHMQGSVGFASGDLSLDDNTLEFDQLVTIDTFTYTDANS